MLRGRRYRYITYSLLPSDPPPLPAWPMRVACAGLNRDFGIRVTGSLADVDFTVRLGDVNATVDWVRSRDPIAPPHLSPCRHRFSLRTAK